MITIDLSTPLSYSPLIPAMQAICKAKPGDKLELIFNDDSCFGDLKEFLSGHGIGFREVYEEERFILQFTKTEAI